LSRRMSSKVVAQQLEKRDRRRQRSESLEKPAVTCRTRIDAQVGEGAHRAGKGEGGGHIGFGQDACRRTDEERVQGSCEARTPPSEHRGLTRGGPPGDRNGRGRGEESRCTGGTFPENKEGIKSPAGSRGEQCSLREGRNKEKTTVRKRLLSSANRYEVWRGYEDNGLLPGREWKRKVQGVPDKGGRRKQINRGASRGETSTTNHLPSGTGKNQTQRRKRKKEDRRQGWEC